MPFTPMRYGLGKLGSVLGSFTGESEIRTSWDRLTENTLPFSAYENAADGCFFRLVLMPSDLTGFQ